VNIPDVYLRRDFERAAAWWGGLIDAAERRHGLPARLLYAVYSRETNMGRHWRTAPPAVFPPAPADDDLTYFIRNAGDGGHGHGIGQVDDRSHVIPIDWATNVAWQVERSAAILASALRAEGGDVVRAANRYNSGQGETSGTTGRDFGPDVYERWRFLAREFSQEAPMPTATAQAALDFFRDNDGLGEFPPGSNNNWITDWYYNWDAAWCAMAISRALNEAWGDPDRWRVPGIAPTSTKGFAYVPYVQATFVNADRFGQNPQVGDLVIFDWDGDGEGDHIGLLDQVVGDGSFLVWEGNTDEGVIRRKRRSMAVIAGFCYVPYPAPAPEPQPQEDDMALPLFGDSPDGRDYGFWMIDGAFKKKLHTNTVWDEAEELARRENLPPPKHIGKIPLAMFDALIDVDELVARD
jgi:hypothetical protein